MKSLYYLCYICYLFVVIKSQSVFITEQNYQNLKKATGKLLPNVNYKFINICQIQ